MVRQVIDGKIIVYHGKGPHTLGKADILSVISCKAKYNPISALMNQKRITNEEAAVNSGYSVGTVDRVRRGIRVKPRALQDITETIEGWPT